MCEHPSGIGLRLHRDNFHLVTPEAQTLYEFCAQRGVLLRLFKGDSSESSSLRFGLPCDEADWLRLHDVLLEYRKEYP